MLHQEVFDRLSVKYPDAVMVRATLENVLPPILVDDIFGQHAGRRNFRKRLFSTVVALLSLVVCRVRNSVPASYPLLEQEFSVGVKAVYNRLRSLPIARSRLWSASRLAGVRPRLDRLQHTGGRAERVAEEARRGTSRE